MSKTFFMTLTPLEPYFFGNEKTFLFDNGEGTARNRYFIKSEKVPMQTTLWGALRYLFMPVKNADFRYSAEEAAKNSAVVGAESFDIRKEVQNFGVLEKLSPVVLAQNGEIYVPTPLDHIAKAALYSPFSDYDRKVVTPEGIKWIPRDFVAKDGLTESFLCLTGENTGKVVPDKEIFGTVVRVGQNKAKDRKAFFKKQFCTLARGWSFGVYVTLDLPKLEALAPIQAAAMQRPQIVYLGQNKTAFRVQFTQAEDRFAALLKNQLTPGCVYCLSDALVPASVYDESYFAAVKTRDYRAYFTHYRKNQTDSSHITKGTELYQLVTAGSLFIPKDMEALAALFHNPGCEKIGFNTIVKKEEDAK